MNTLLAAARRSAAHPTTAFPLPVAGRGLPKALPATAVGSTTGAVAAPMRVVGSLTAPGGATLTGPTATAGHFSGVLTDTATFTLTMPTAGGIALAVTATPSLDERTLLPPQGTSWTSWGSSDVNPVAARAATAQLIDAAAAAARGAELSPYVGADTAGPASTRFRYSLSEPTATARPPQPVHAHPVALGVVAAAGLLVLGAAAAIWRRA
jgi:hypothetical protein